MRTGKKILFQAKLVAIEAVVAAVVLVFVVVVVVVVVELVDEEEVVILVLGNLSPVSNGEQWQVQDTFHQSLMASNENGEKDIVLGKISSD